MLKHDHIRTLALELSYAHTSMDEDQWLRLWRALRRADPALAAEIEAAWRAHKPCFANWLDGDPYAEFDHKTCECGAWCDEVPRAAA
jgi:hypothetical protein